jgi:PPK2 family polyphosphate:nucleotide phosphotransferase
MGYADQFRVKPGRKFKIAQVDPGFTGRHEGKDTAKREIAQQLRKLWDLQYRLFAENQRSVLICLQAMDAGGKDGTINHVIGAMNPQGARVHSFKVPTPVEAAHDFLWRIHRQTPAKGEVVAFNRSQYEDVLVVRVHNLVPKAVWSKRYDLINAFEHNLVEAGTRVLKFFLHISKDEQLARFKERVDDPARRWKISDADYAERAFWPAYQAAYEEAITKTSTKHAPWYVIPANHKWFRNLAVSTIVVEALESLHIQLPKPSVDIAEIRRKYHAAAADKS